MAAANEETDALIAPDGRAPGAEEVEISDEQDLASKQKYYNNKVFKPPFILALFTLINFFTYYDRGTMAAVLVEVRTDDTIAGHGELSEAKAGALVSMFMAGFFATNPIFVGVGGYFSAKQIINFGLIAWVVACIGSGLSQNYAMLIICRGCVGIGEAAYAGFTVTILDNIATRKKRTMWIGTFYSMLPVGTAMGMAVSGYIAADVSFGKLVGWRVAFILEVIPMIIIIGIMFFMPAVYNPVKGKEDTETKPVEEDLVEGEGTPSEASLTTDNGDLAVNTGTAINAGGGDHSPTEGGGSLSTPLRSTRRAAEKVALARATKVDAHVPFKEATKAIFTNLDFLLLAFGYGMYAFVIGAVSSFAISMLVQGPLKMSAVFASILIGLSTAFTGLVGSVVGGLAVDKLGGSHGYNGVFKCTVFSAAMMAISLPLGLVAMAAETLWLLVICFIAGVFCLFSVTAPISASLLSSVPRSLRTYSISFSIFIMHFIGDFPSPIIAGVLSDAFSGGCDSIRSENVCNNSMAVYNNSAPPHCRWNPKTQHSHGYCANIYQLRNALMIVFLVLALAVPAWSTVAIRMKRRVRRGIMNVDMLLDEKKVKFFKY